MQYGVRWDDRCLAELEEIYGDVETSDIAVFTVDWKLAHDPNRFTWELSPNSDILLTWIRGFRGFPAVCLSFRLVFEQNNRYCLMLRARRSNHPSMS
jgi:hypothetical protein